MVKQQKLDAVEALKKRIEAARVIGMLDMHKLPSKQYQEINKKLRDEVEFVMVNKTILLRALEGASKAKIKDIEKLVPTQPALVFTKLDPFKFYMRASKMKSPTYAKEGDLTDEEILVSAGPTGLMPGPVISEFAKVKIPAGVEEGKISVKKDTLVAKKGDAISKDLANILRKLKIQPVKVGLKIVAVYDDGSIYMDDVLSLAGQGYVDQMAACHQKAMNLSVASGYPTKSNIGLLLAKAYRESQALGSLVKTDVPAEAAAQAEAPAAETPTETGKSE
ncbi:MAG: 50S ribosomal protein L10 [Candidatus Aenigmarchaeota archaeon]|nr:50S ribosomal protein L10 [Candidatus Aenigmarchaeota archaeon]